MTHPTASLKLHASKGPMPTVEINIDKLDNAEIALDEFVCPTLAALARRAPDQSCTIYQFMTQSVNFMHNCWSVFLIIDGSERFLTGLADGIGYRKESESRISDSIPPLAGTPLYHLQDGELWANEDGDWKRLDAYDDVTEYDEEELTEEDPGDEEDDDWNDEEEEEEEEENETTTVTRAKPKGRQRAARNDARVGKIKTKIETLFGLPEGSVVLQGPDGRPLRADAFIRTLRARWGYDN